MDSGNRGCHGRRGLMRHRVCLVAARGGAGHSRANGREYPLGGGGRRSAGRWGCLSRLLEGEQEELSDIDPREAAAAGEDVEGLDFSGRHPRRRGGCRGDSDRDLDLVGKDLFSLTPRIQEQGVYVPRSRVACTHHHLIQASVRLLMAAAANRVAGKRWSAWSIHLSSLL